PDSQNPKRPRLVCRVLGQQREYCPVMLFLPLRSVRQHDRRVGLEDRRDGGGNGPACECAAGDPGDLGVCSDAPLPAAFGPPPAWIILSGLGHTATMVRQLWRARGFGNVPGGAVTYSRGRKYRAICRG